MAGIGFSLNKLLRHDSLTRTFAAYTVAGIISGGPWLISIFAISILALMVTAVPEYRQPIAQFQMSITYLIAGSLIFSGSVSNAFSRYASDQVFMNRSTYIISNLNGLMMIITTLGGVFAFFYVLYFFPEQDLLYRCLLIGNFIVLSNSWVVITLLTALKDYQLILKIFFVSYGVIVGLGYSLRGFGLDGFMFSFLIGQLVLLLTLFFAVYKEYPTNSIIDFHFLKKNSMFGLLICSGLFFNLAVWIDKFVFWYSPQTGYPVIGSFHASSLYDVPILIAYLCLLPGMAVFLLLIETDFADYYSNFNESIREGKSFACIQIAGDQMIAFAFNVIYSIIKIQALVIIIIFQFGEKILAFVHASVLYYNILNVAVIGTSLQVVLLAIIDILYYLDRRWDVFILSFLFFVLNLIFTPLSVHFGPFFYGYGFTCALAIVCTLGIYFLHEEFTDLEYKVIMLHP